MAAAESSLHIGLDVTRTKAVLRASEQCRSDLNRLAARFPGGVRDRLALELTLDDFLVGIDVLADWPHPESVVWTDELSALVGEVLDDADRAEQQLQTPRADTVWDATAVASALGPTWRADLTEFQRRDIGRLLSLQHGANFSVPGAGKTRVGLAVYAAMRERGEVRRLLVVSPKSAYEAWLTESELCFKEPPLTAVMGRTPDGMAEILVVNYERLDRSLASLATWLRGAPSMIILDEAHRMKLGAQGTYGSACMALGPLTRRRLILTGTASSEWGSRPGEPAVVCLAGARPESGHTSCSRWRSGVRKLGAEAVVHADDEEGAGAAPVRDTHPAPADAGAAS